MKLRESWAAFGSVYNDFMIPIKIKTAIATEGIHDSLNTYTGSRSSHTLVAVQVAPSGHYWWLKCAQARAPGLYIPALKENNSRYVLSHTASPS